MTLERQRRCMRCRKQLASERFGLGRRVCFDCEAADTTSQGTYTPARHRRYAYGLDEAEYQTLLAAHDGRCPICTSRFGMLVVDHDHRTGQVRGLLCDRCNRALGHLQDSPGIAARAAEYLRISRRP